MNRIITILVTIFILLLLYIWISHVWGSDKPSHPRQIVDARDMDALGVDDPSGDVDTSLSSPGLDIPDESEDEYTEPEPEPKEEIVPEEKEPMKSEPAKKPVIEEKKTTTVTQPKAEPKPKTTPANPPATKTSQPIAKTTTVTDTDGKHMVIVGNFLQRVNADQRLQELKKAGFTDVEVVNFDLSEYHTVTAGRFDDINEARRLVKKLKDYHKIDAYVRIGS